MNVEFKGERMCLKAESKNDESCCSLCQPLGKVARCMRSRGCDAEYSIWVTKARRLESKEMGTFIVNRLSEDLEMLK